MRSLTMRSSTLLRAGAAGLVAFLAACGAPLQAFQNKTSTALQYGVMTKQAITSWGALKGKLIMIAGPKDNTAYYFHIMARPNGLKDDDYDFQFAGSSGARFAALKSGAA